jgi:hypothetical protein
MEHINIHCVNEELFHVKTGSSYMGGRFAISLGMGKYGIIIHMYSSQHCASVIPTDMRVAGMGT